MQFTEHPPQPKVFEEHLSEAQVVACLQALFPTLALDNRNATWHIEIDNTKRQIENLKSHVGEGRALFDGDLSSVLLYKMPLRIASRQT